MMKGILGGGLENAVIRQITAEFAPERLQTTHSYYRGLQRVCETNAFSRAATVLTIAEEVRLPEVDWTSSMVGADAPGLEALGWEPYHGAQMWNESWVNFVEQALDAKAFSPGSQYRLTHVPPVEGEVDTSETTRGFAVHHLMRLLLQIDAGRDGEARLFLSPGDQAVLSDLTAFAKTSVQPPPLDLPDFDQAVYDAEARSITLLAFQPPDVLSLLPVRKDIGVRKYADRVTELWEVADPVERERAAVAAMRKVIDADEVRGWAATAFEAAAWGIKPLSWLGVPGAAIISEARDFADVARERERKASNWLLIRTLMNDISLADYLRRTDNL